MPAERGKDAAERFAAAVEQGRSPRSAGSDVDLARELEIVNMLRSHGAAYAPRPDEKARAKQRLMALLAEPDGRADAAAPPDSAAAVVAFPPVTAADRTSPIPVVRVAEPEAGSVETDGADDPADEAPLAPVTPLAGRAARRAGRHSLAPSARSRPAPAGRRPGLARRAGLVGSAALFVLITFTGAGVFASRDALPGQTLYPLTRAAEAAGLAMTFDDEARAQRNLELAATRLTEVERLIALRGGSGVDPQLVAAAMSEFDVATSEGSRTLLGGQDAARNGGTLQAWAAAQSARLSALRPALPVPAVPAADTSIALLDELLGRSADPAAPSTGEDTGTADEAREAGTSGQPSARVPAGTPGGQPSAESERGLPPLQPDNGPLTGEPQVEQPAGETPSDVDGQEPGRLPLPLPGAPITLPPLLPGMPPLIIG